MVRCPVALSAVIAEVVGEVVPGETQFRQPAFLPGEAHEPRHRLRCAVHGFIHFSDAERAVIDHRLFRRLRYIRQLALTEFVYPGASHTRFEHSLGVMEVAGLAFDRLAANSGGRMEAAFREVEQLGDHPMAKARQVVRLAALLHDSGHASFSHAAEEAVFAPGHDHEALSVKILREAQYLGELLNNGFWPGCGSLVALLIAKSPELPPQLKLLQDLVSGEMDADRMDYLLRDAYHCGVDYGRFDLRRLLECLAVEEGQAGQLEIALHRDGLHAYEAMVIARYHMNVQVYLHRLRRIYDRYLVEYHKALPDQRPWSDDAILASNDVIMLRRLMADAEAGEGEHGAWARRIIERKHHRVLYEAGISSDPIDDERRAVEVCGELRNAFEGVDFRHDIAKAKITKLSADGTKDAIRLALVTNSGRSRQVVSVSQVLGRLPREFICVRIYGDTADLPAGQRAEIESKASTLWREKLA